MDTHSPSVRAPLARRARGLAALLGLAAALGLAASLAPPAWAARAYALELEPGYAFVVASGGEQLHGGSVGARFYAAAREFLMVGAAARYVAAGGAGLGQATGVAATAAFRLDVLQWVPFASLDVGYLANALPGSAGLSHDLELALGLGLDYLRSRDLAIGGFARYHVAATATARLPAMVTAGLRVVLRWE